MDLFDNRPRDFSNASIFTLKITHVVQLLRQCCLFFLEVEGFPKFAFSFNYIFLPLLDVTGPFTRSLLFSRTTGTTLGRHFPIITKLNGKKAQNF